MLHFLVGIADDLPGRIKHVPRRRPEAQGTVLGLFQLAAQEPAPQPVQLRFAHGALEAKQEAVIILAGVINALFINDEGIGQSTDFEQPIPIA